MSNWRGVASAAASVFDSISREEQFNSRMRDADASARRRLRANAIERAVERRAAQMRRETAEQAQAAKAARAGISAFARLEASLRGPATAVAALPAKAQPRMAAPPEEPKDGECCGSDCRHCVWTVYWEQLQVWEQQQEADGKPG